jgi:hypothetical protein
MNLYRQRHVFYTMTKNYQKKHTPLYSMHVTARCIPLYIPVNRQNLASFLEQSEIESSWYIGHYLAYYTTRDHR